MLISKEKEKGGNNLLLVRMSELSKVDMHQLTTIEHSASRWAGLILLLSKSHGIDLVCNI